MKNTIEILNTIKNISGSKAKQQILIDNKDNELLKKILYYTYNPNLMYGISEPKLKEMNFDVEPIEMGIFDMLSILSTHNINDRYRQMFIGTMANYTSEEQELIKSIVIKDLRIGVNISTINKVWKGLIPVFSCQLANNVKDVKLVPDEKIFITEKLDGFRCLSIKQDRKVTLYSRQGKQLLGLNDIVSELSKIEGEWVFDGELKVLNDSIASGLQYKETSKIVSSKTDDKTGVGFYIFDMITHRDFDKGQSMFNYELRRLRLEGVLEPLLHTFECIKLVPLLYSGTDHSQIDIYLQNMLNLGKEGVMINRNVPYMCKRNNGILKAKSILTCDIMCTGVEEGIGKNTGKLGALVCDYKGTKCNVGGGFTDKQREEFWNNPDLVVGRVIEVEYTEECCDETGRPSMRFARFKSVREEGKEVSYS